MSTLTARLFGKGPEHRRVIVPSPSAPMRVARELLRVRHMHPDGALLRSHRGAFYTWAGTCWKEIATRDIRSFVYDFLEDAEFISDAGALMPFAPTRKKVDDVVDALHAIALLRTADDAPLWTEPGAEDVDPSQIVSTLTGLLHVPTRTLLPHTPRFFNYHALPFPFLADTAPPERWLQFLRQLWPDDESSIRTIQEMMGYILGGDTRLQKIFLLVGPRRGGKGTIGRVLTALLGQHNVAAPPVASLSAHFGLQPLIGRPLAMISDARLGSSDNRIMIERLLSISGEDSLTIDRKFLPPWTGKLPTRFMILTNELPKLSDASGALVSRFVPLVLTESFLGREDPRLTDALVAEAPSIFNWALEGLDRLNIRGHFQMSDGGREALQQLEDLSSPMLAFVREVCTVGPYEVPVDALWHAWKAECASDNRHPGTKATFGRDLRAAVPSVRRVKPRLGSDRRVYTYTGITFSRSLEEHDPSGLGPLGPGLRTGPDGPRSGAL